MIGTSEQIRMVEGQIRKDVRRLFELEIQQHDGAPVDRDPVESLYGDIERISRLLATLRMESSD